MGNPSAREVVAQLTGQGSFAQRFWNSCNECFLNIETGSDATGPGARKDQETYRGSHAERTVHKDNNYYIATGYYTIRWVLKALSLSSDDVFYDIGCGKGRVLCVAARMRLKKVVGVEVFEELGGVARRNAERLRGRKTPIEVISEDATKLDYSDGTVFYFWDPFGESTMREVMAKIRESYYKKPRNIRIGYYDPICNDVLAQEPWLEKILDHRSGGRVKVSFWRSK